MFVSQHILKDKKIYIFFSDLGKIYTSFKGRKMYQIAAKIREYLNDLKMLTDFIYFLKRITFFLPCISTSE